MAQSSTTTTKKTAFPNAFPRLGTPDAEVKVPCAEKPELLKAVSFN